MHFRPPDGECWLRIKHSLWSMTLTPLFASWLRTFDFQTIDCTEMHWSWRHFVGTNRRWEENAELFRLQTGSFRFQWLVLAPRVGNRWPLQGFDPWNECLLHMLERCEDTSTSTCLNTGNIGISSDLRVSVLSKWSCLVGVVCVKTFHDWSLFQGSEVEIP